MGYKFHGGVESKIDILVLHTYGSRDARKRKIQEYRLKRIFQQSYRKENRPFFFFFPFRKQGNPPPPARANNTHAVMELCTSKQSGTDKEKC